MKEKKARVEDAMHATRAAVEEGIVPGGGVALVRAAKALEKFLTNKDGEGDPDEQIGVNIVRRALEEPLRQIVQNAGKEGAVVVERFALRRTKTSASTRQTEEYEDLVKAGVIDPAKVTRTALQNAASIAGLMLTTEAMVSRFLRKTKLLRHARRYGWHERNGDVNQTIWFVVNCGFALVAEPLFFCPPICEDSSLQPKNGFSY